MASSISFEKFGETSFELQTPDGTSAVSFPLNGRHNIMNRARCGRRRIFIWNKRAINRIELRKSSATARSEVKFSVLLPGSR